jgi:hypothetical protein
MKQYLCILLITASTNIFGQISFEKSYGGAGYDGTYCVQQTDDEGYIICGISSQNSDPFPSDFYIIKTDEYGDTLWCKIYTGQSADSFTSVQQTSDGGYIVSGASLSFGIGNYDAILMKLDNNGDTIWFKTYGGLGPDYAKWCLEIDGGYIFVGNTGSYGAGDKDIYLVRTDMNGDTLWTRTFGGIGFDQSSEIEETSDGGYIISGSTESISNGEQDVLLLKTTSNGILEWQKIYGSYLDDSGLSVQQTNDSGYIIAGQSGSYSTGEVDGYVIKTDLNGDTLWTKKFGGSSIDRLYSVKQTPDDGYIIAGQTESYGAGNYDALLLKLDNSGNTVWFKTFGGTSADGAFCIQQTNDGGFILTGITESIGYGSMDAYLLKVDGNGNIITNCPENTYSSNLKIFPNPTHDYLNITSNKQIELSIYIYSISGDIIHQEKYKQNQIKLDCRCFSLGIYFIKTMYGNVVETHKIIIK